MLIMNVCLISDGPASCQQLLDVSNRWLKWSGMKPKVSKCQAMAVEASTGKVYDSTLILGGVATGSQPVFFWEGLLKTQICLVKNLKPNTVLSWLELMLPQ